MAASGGEAGPAPGLGRRAARGAAIVLGGQLARMLLQILSIIVLARLLSPSDYGLVAMVLAIVGIGEIFRDFGLSSAAVQAKTLSHEQRSNLFWLNTAIGCGLGLLVLGTSELIARAYGHEELGEIARVLALTFVLSGLATQFRADLNRRLRFALLATADISAAAVGLALAVAGAVQGWGYWALVAQQLGQGLMLLVLMAAFSRWVPGRPRRGAEMGGMLRFGGNLVASQLLGYASNNVDSVIIGVRFGPAPLGLYNRGYQLLMGPLGQIRAPSTTVALPVLSRLLEDPKRYVDFVIRGQLALGYTLIAALGLIIGTSTELTSVVLGDGWEGVAPVLRLLAIAGACQTLAYVGYWVYLSRGLTGALVRYTAVTATVKIVCIGTGSIWGINGVAAGFAVAHAAEWPISLFWLNRVTGLELRPLFRGALRIVAVTAVVSLAAWGGTVAGRGLAEAAALALGLLCGVAGYLVTVGLVPWFRHDARGILDTVRMVGPARRAATAPQERVP